MVIWDVLVSSKSYPSKCPIFISEYIYISTSLETKPHTIHTHFLYDTDSPVVKVNPNENKKQITPHYPTSYINIYLPATISTLFYSPYPSQYLH